jgi:hypothetical protein
MDCLVYAMNEDELKRERITLERKLTNGLVDFAGTYLAVSGLHRLIKSSPSLGGTETVTALEDVLKSVTFSSETQSYFLYREAAEALVFLSVHSTSVAGFALEALEGLLGTTQGPSQRASIEALGSLPLHVRGPMPCRDSIGQAPKVTWREVAEKAGIANSLSLAVKGRSVVARTNDDHMVLVVKLAQDKQAVQSAYDEAIWMEYLQSVRFSFPVRFHIPTPLKIHESFVFRLFDLPGIIGEEVDVKAECHGLAFFAHKDYFTYPNDHQTEMRLSPEQFREVMLRCAWLFGKLATEGIVHDSPIPLFHNRVQRQRREDQGRYEWQRGGRLDRWLESCAYPNFGVTGIRDFEHLISFAGLSRKLCYHVGSQLLGLLLTAGSYFRSKDAARVGFDKDGNAMDARDLFDKPFFQDVIRGVFCHYYRAFTGKELDRKLPFSIDSLTSRMIEEMGVDRHMEEVLRVVDQASMSEGAFREFLMSRGYTEKDMGDIKKGHQDIILYTGPHLGGFNERISLPELIEAVGAMSALCIAGKFRQAHSFEPLTLQPLQEAV